MYRDVEIERLNNIIDKALCWLSENTHYTSLKVDKLIQDDNTNLLELLDILNKGNDEIEIIEEDKKIEKLKILSDNKHYSNVVLYGKINEIIDYINGSDKE